MADETRVVLIKPGDVLLIGNLGHGDPSWYDPLLVGLKGVGIETVYLFAEDIDIAKIPAVSRTDLLNVRSNE